MSKEWIDCPSSIFDVCAVITTFRPDEGFLERVRRIQSQVGSVVIVDDGNSTENVVQLHSWFPESSDIILHHNPMNVGLGASLNKGISIAKHKGYHWVLTLDDDTAVFPNMMANLIKACQTVTKGGGKPVAIMGMSALDEGVASFPRPSADGPLVVEKRGIITSGSLISLSVYHTIGGFREEFFIDSIDYDYCLRARANGYRVLRVCQVGMTHRLGHASRHQIGPFDVVTTNHDPIRRYYAFRNSTVLMREHLNDDPLYSLAVIFFQLKTLALVLLAESNKRNKLMWMVRGLWDAWRKRLGKHDVTKNLL